jgi:Fe-S-cluster-containing dehydrogenase component
MGLAGLVGAGCIRKPTQYILPYTQRPEDLIPGEPRFFATSLQVGASVVGLLVESQDGRPTKIEGNPQHPISRGATDAQTQAVVLSMYDPDRSQSPRHNGADVSWEEAGAGLEAVRESIVSTQGAGWALVLQDRRSPTVRALIERLRLAAPSIRVFVVDETRRTNHIAGLSAVGVTNAQPLFHLDRATTVVALDSDFLGVEGDNVFHARAFAANRRPIDQNGSMSRLYAIEPAFTITGATADNRLQLPASQVGEFLKGLANYLGTKGIVLPGGLQNLAAAETNATWIEKLGDDLVEHRQTAALLVGDRQPAWVHGLAMALNDALGSVGTVVEFFTQDDRIDAPGLPELATAITDGAITRAIFIGGNPVFDATGDVDFAAAVGRLEESVHLSFSVDETTTLCKWHIPMSHDLECWGDTRATDRTVAIRQPLIDPLYESMSEVELLAALLDDAALSEGYDANTDGELRGGYAQVRRTWRSRAPEGFDATWRTWIHNGVVVEPNVQPTAVAIVANDLGSAVSAIAAPAAGALELVFALDNKVLDGRYANNAWLQELPDPITKLTWDNAALINVETANELGLVFENAVDPFDGTSRPEDEFIPATLYGRLQVQLVTITVNGRSFQIAAMPTPGVARNTLILPLGYGRTAGGRVAEQGKGFSVAAGRSVASPWIVAGATLAMVGETYTLASTQDHGSMEGRPIAREATLDEYQQHPSFVTDDELMPDYKLRSLWNPPNRREGQQWGMNIDLTTCTGCNACSIACTAENNISVVGKERILQGREMHWIRLDRYYSGMPDNPQAIMQPVACMHCEMAPCEQVCPVAATVHGPEGTNDMAYNRCIGTRYCANNCPFKVRRYNFFAFAKENDRENPLLRLQKNPDVTVRFRGVMEKCTYCIQRVNEARIDAKVQGNDIIQDGAVTPACAQACPSQAIVFGDINDPTSRVSIAKSRNRDYAVLSWLNVHPRTTYLAKIRNPNPHLPSA